MGVSDALQNASEKGYKLSADLSFADVGAVRAFPDNLVFESQETFTSDTMPGDEANNIAPDPKTISLVVRHTLVRLPDDRYQVRRAGPSGSGAFPPSSSTTVRHSARTWCIGWPNGSAWKKIDPSAGRSRVKSRLSSMLTLQRPSLFAMR